MIFGFHIEKQPLSKLSVGVFLFTGLILKWLTYILFFGGIATAIYKVYVDFRVLTNRPNLDMELVFLKVAGAVAVVLIAVVVIYLFARALIITPLNAYLHFFRPMIREDYIDLLEIAGKKEIKAYIDDVAHLNPKREITRGEFDMLQRFYDERQIDNAFAKIYSGDV